MDYQIDRGRSKKPPDSPSPRPSGPNQILNPESKAERFSISQQLTPSKYLSADKLSPTPSDGKVKQNHPSFTRSEIVRREVPTPSPIRRQSKSEIGKTPSPKPSREEGKTTLDKSKTTLHKSKTTLHKSKTTLDKNKPTLGASNPGSRRHSRQMDSRKEQASKELTERSLNKNKRVADLITKELFSQTKLGKQLLTNDVRHSRKGVRRSSSAKELETRDKLNVDDSESRKKSSSKRSLTGLGQHKKVPSKRRSPRRLSLLKLPDVQNTQRDDAKKKSSIRIKSTTNVGGAKKSSNMTTGKEFSTKVGQQLFRSYYFANNDKTKRREKPALKSEYYAQLDSVEPHAGTQNKPNCNTAMPEPADVLNAQAEYTGEQNARAQLGQENRLSDTEDRENQRQKKRGESARCDLPPVYPEAPLFKSNRTSSTSSTTTASSQHNCDLSLVLKNIDDGGPRKFRKHVHHGKTGALGGQ